MESILELFKHLTNADWITQHGGLYLVALIVFAETGLFVGFFLPGDSLLFVTGLIIAQSASPFDTAALNLPYRIILITLSGIIGN